MNYLKKKITKVVGNPKRKNDDDDDFDNYVPEIPPHPSTLTTTTTTTDINDQLKIKFDSTNTNFANFDSVNNITVGEPFPLSFGEQEQQQQQEQPKLSLEELKAKEEEYRKEEREKLRQQEESKKDCEEWKFFLSLTAKADAVTSKTQTVLEKLQTESAVKEISKFEDPTFSDQFDETAPKNIGAWAAFDETADYNPSDPIFQFPKQDETEQQQSIDKDKTKPVIDEETKRIARELIEDFGFTNPAPGIPLVDGEKTKTDTSLFAIEEPTIDPFDTSFIDVEAIKSGESILKPTLIKDIDVDEIDPFDTSYIESTIQKDLAIKD
ncbi:hypothetical protein DERF_011154 [Dermatophagoides farinae]|uniref:Uncharacterized protein n=1 Tax=Dermatophagoides farinae TaxID=6954 RepID=A0A922HRP0_DERFA|nr:hypothetical protein DERF_011154 [Dermatophagoides farinae]